MIMKAEHSEEAMLNMNQENVDQRKLVILGLPWETAEETLRTYFSQFGAIDETVIMKDRYSGKSRGFGFVTFMYPADAQRVVGTEHQVDGRRYFTFPMQAISSKEMSQQKNLWRLAVWVLMQKLLIRTCQ